MSGIDNKDNIIKYLEALVQYLVSIPGDLTGEDVSESVVEVFGEGGDITMTIAERWVKEGEERGKKEGEKRGEEKGKKEGKWEVAMNMLRKGLSIEFIAECTGFPIDKIKQAIQSQQQQSQSGAPA